MSAFSIPEIIKYLKEAANPDFLNLTRNRKKIDFRNVMISSH